MGSPGRKLQFLPQCVVYWIESRRPLVRWSIRTGPRMGPALTGISACPGKDHTNNDLTSSVTNSYLVLAGSLLRSFERENLESAELPCPEKEESKFLQGLCTLV